MYFPLPYLPSFPTSRQKNTTIEAKLSKKKAGRTLQTGSKMLIKN
jgi:hypothetical protein